MKCPNCGGRESIQIDMHSEGFSAEESPVKECGTCGLVWRIKVTGDIHEVDIIKQPEKK